MALSVNTLGREGALDSFIASFNLGGVIEIRTLAPGLPDAVAAGVVLATIPLGVNAFDAAGTTAPATVSLVAGVSDNLGDANGTAGNFRMYNNAVPASATSWVSGTVGAIGSGADMILDDGAGGTAITTADVVTVASMTLTI